MIFGSRVLPNGRPSGSLRRRALGAVRWARERGVRPLFVASGGRPPDAAPRMPTEAAVIRDLLLAAGIPSGDIVLETESQSTLDNVVHCCRILDRLDVGAVHVCSDDYHVPRSWLLMRLAGRAARSGKVSRCQPLFVRGVRSAVGNATWVRYWLHEVRAVFRDASALVGGSHAGAAHRVRALSAPPAAAPARHRESTRRIPSGR